MPRAGRTHEHAAAAAEEAWTQTIGRLPPRRLIDWLTGTGEPPAPARAEVDGALGRLAAGAGEAGVLSCPATEWVVSGVRDLSRQLAIWERKIGFSGPPFDRISDHARAVCGPLLVPASGPWQPALDAHRSCWGAAPWPPGAPSGARALGAAERAREVLQASAAPALSRHHWGTDADLVSVTAADWADSGPLAPLHRWLAAHAAEHGFARPFTAGSGGYGRGPDEERWHWSYAPIARPLLRAARRHDAALEARLRELWAGRPELEAVLGEWRAHLFGIDPALA